MAKDKKSTPEEKLAKKIRDKVNKKMDKIHGKKPNGQ